MSLEDHQYQHSTSRPWKETGKWMWKTVLRSPAEAMQLEIPLGVARIARSFSHPHLLLSATYLLPSCSRQHGGRKIHNPEIIITEEVTSEKRDDNIASYNIYRLHESFQREHISRHSQAPSVRRAGCCGYEIGRRKSFCLNTCPIKHRSAVKVSHFM